ncbi:MAG: hypothetical protein WCS35_09765, partial [Sphaerochaeta sp.]
CNYRKFKMDERLIEEFDVEDITARTIGDDFARDPKIHYCFLTKHRSVVKVAPPKKKLVLKNRVQEEEESYIDD